MTPSRPFFVRPSPLSPALAALVAIAVPTTFAAPAAFAQAPPAPAAASSTAAPDAPSPPAAAPASGEAAPEGPAGPAQPKGTRDDLLTFYKDNYFLTGFTHDTEVKFQFSAKFDLWPNDTPHAFYLGFTEKSRWDLYQRSAPFIENNYNPEVFYTFFHHQGRYDPPPGCAFFSERLGLEHESDGVAGPQSRGWNRVYGESRFACYDHDRDYGLVALKLWAPPFGAGDNPDITKFLGYGELALSVGAEGQDSPVGGADLTALLRKGTGSLGAGSLEIDARWRPPYGGFWRFTPYLYTQFFTGYGETLFNYDHALTTIRVGIGLSDRSTRAK